LAIIDNNATTKKAMPVQNRSPVTKYTMAATIIAGIRTRNSFMRIMTTKPIMIKMIRKGRLSEPSPMLLRIEYIIGRISAKFMR
jgi:hypothetical protein